MEAVEFRNSPDGNVYYTEKGKTEKRFTKFSSDIVDHLNRIIRERFPVCYAELMTLYKYDRSREYKIAERFVRCNFGEHDLLQQDIQNDILNFEEVKCPLRGGFCKYENVICKPKGIVHLSPAEKEVVNLYVKGYTFDAISDILNKKPSTIKTQLLRVKTKLNVKSCREIITELKRINIIF